MENDKIQVYKNFIKENHQKHMSKYTRFASELIFRSRRKNAWLRLFDPILSENEAFTYEFYP